MSDHTRFVIKGPFCRRHFSCGGGEGDGENIDYTQDIAYLQAGRPKSLAGPSSMPNFDHAEAVSAYFVLHSRPPSLNGSPVPLSAPEWRTNKTDTRREDDQL